VPAEDPAGRAVPPPAPEIVDGGTMEVALQQANPYIALLVSALQDGQRWIDGPAEGLVHDSYYDGMSGTLSHSAALRWIGLVTKGGLNAVQLDITVTADLRTLAWLKQVADTAFPAAIVPGTIHGVVTDGGLHGSLVAISPDGKSQPIQW
jgi:hypothetical protein